MRRPLTIAAIGLAATLAGCGGPDRANVELRRERQELRERVDGLERQVASLKGRLAAATTRPTTVPAGSVAVDEIFAVTELRLGRLTRVEDGRLQVYATPVDASGDTLKVAGSFRVEAFDLAASSDVQVIEHRVPASQARDSWRSGRLFSGYVLAFDWPGNVEADEDVVVRVAFRDALTRRTVRATVQLGQ